MRIEMRTRSGIVLAAGLFITLAAGSVQAQQGDVRQADLAPPPPAIMENDVQPIQPVAEDVQRIQPVAEEVEVMDEEPVLIERRANPHTSSSHGRAVVCDEGYHPTYGGDESWSDKVTGTLYDGDEYDDCPDGDGDGSSRSKLRRGLRRLCCKLGYFRQEGCCGAGCPPRDCYHMAYEVNPEYFDPRDGQVFAAQGYGVPMAVPLAPNVNHTYNYGWGIPSSRLTPISRFYPEHGYIGRQPW